MTSGEIALWTLRGILAAIPFVATIYLYFYLLRPSDMRVPGELIYFIKKFVLYIAFLVLSVLWAAVLLGGSAWWILLLSLGVGAIFVFLYLPLFVILVKVQIRIGGYDTRDTEDVCNKSFFEMIFGARREYSEYCVDKYHSLMAENADRKNRLRRLATRAVRKNKKNPEAQYILGESYLNLGEVTKALKHASEALRLEPGNEKYKALCAQVEKGL